MLVIPAIDMKDHQVVRLKQGLMEDSTVYRSSIVEQAEIWISEGTQRLHLVDLNGAFAGKPEHLDEIIQISQAHPHVPIQVGGGIRSFETLETYFENGVSFCILGTIALKDPAFLEDACKRYPGKIILGVDAKNGFVATEGWADVSEMPATDLIARYKDLTLESVVYTDISKDGMLQGMNLEEIAKVNEIGIPVIASGGLTSLDDIKALKNIEGIHGVIAGKAIYENRFSLADALECAC